MKKSPIYTRGGDAGTTSLVSGARVSKGDSRIALYGEVDELNSRLGMAMAYMKDEEKTKHQIPYLESIQSALFDLGANLACEEAKRAEWKLPQLSTDQVAKLERQIDELDSEVMPLKNFILPGGHLASASLHLARTHCRCVERLMVGFQTESGEELPENSLVFVNRLSDYFFVLARWVNKKAQINEPNWKPN